jgi:hypothetical protein
MRQVNFWDGINGMNGIFPGSQVVLGNQETTLPVTFLVAVIESILGVNSGVSRENESSISFAP